MITVKGKGEFEAQVVQSTLPVVVEFYGDWCVPCKQLSPILEDLSREYPQVKFVRVDVGEDNWELTEMFVVKDLPTVLIFSTDGFVNDVVVGTAPKDIYKQKIEKVVFEADLPPEIKKIMEYDVICDHDDDFLCPRRYKKIVEFVKGRVEGEGKKERV